MQSLYPIIHSVKNGRAAELRGNHLRNQLRMMFNRNQTRVFGVNLVFRTLFFIPIFVPFESAIGESPYVLLGPAAPLGFSQPMIEVEVLDSNRSLGPTTSSRFLLDTGANGIVVASEAYNEMRSRGYEIEGTVREQGVAGFSVFDVSAPYTMRLTDHSGSRRELADARLMSTSTTSFCQLGLCPFYGIAGMPAMTGNVASLDLTSGDIFDAIGLGDGIDTTFSSSVPSTGRTRYSVPFNVVEFLPDASGPEPTWADLPFMKLDPVHNNSRQTGNFLLDTGAQLSLMSSTLAFALGLDRNGNGSLFDEAASTIEIGGIGGTVSAPQLFVDELRIPTAEGVELIVTDVQFAIVDIDPQIDGIFGMNLLGGGVDLLGGLGGEATGDYFHFAHFDFTTLQSAGTGSLILDMKSGTPGIRIPEGGHGDLNNDGVIDFEDRVIWVEDVQNTHFGDSNLDGVFDSRDFVTVFTAGEYEDELVKNSTWATGDWNGDWEFNTRDLVTAFQAAGYDKPPRSIGVPEPECAMLLMLVVPFFRLRR